MTPDEIALLQIYGPWFVIIILVLKDLLPFLRDKLFPAYMKNREQDAADRRSLNERKVLADENLAKAMQQLSVLFGTINDRTEITAAGMQRVERVVTEINTRTKTQDTIRFNRKKGSEA